MKFIVLANKTCVPLKNARKTWWCTVLNYISKLYVDPMSKSSSGERGSHQSCFPSQKKKKKKLRWPTYIYLHNKICLRKSKKKWQILKNQTILLQIWKDLLLPREAYSKPQSCSLGKYGGNTDVSICGRLFLSWTQIQQNALSRLSAHCHKI